MRLFRKRKYIISTMVFGIEYFYQGENDNWTPIWEGAKTYTKKEAKAINSKWKQTKIIEI